MKKLAILMSILLSFVIMSESLLAAGEVVIVTSFPKDLFEVCKRAFEAKYPDITVGGTDGNSLSGWTDRRSRAAQRRSCFGRLRTGYRRQLPDLEP